MTPIQDSQIPILSVIVSPVLGTFLNVGGILLGGMLGLMGKNKIPEIWQVRLRNVLGLMVLYVGISTAFSAGFREGFLRGFGLMFLGMISLVAGNAIGMGLGIQKKLNRLADWVTRSLEKDSGGEGQTWSMGFVTCSVLFCVGPMAILGSIQDGLEGDFKILAIKSVMDGLASLFFATRYGWGVLVSALPVLAYQGSLTLMAQMLRPLLEEPVVLDALNVVGGLLVVCLSVLVFGIKKVPLANYLPALVVAPILAHWFLE